MYDKVQVMEIIRPFGYEEDGNDYHLLNHKDIIAHRVD